MPRIKSESSELSSDQGDRTLDNSSTSRLSTFSHCSAQKEAAGDFRPERNPVDVKYAEKTAVRDSSRGTKCTRDELFDKVKYLVDGISKQEKYLRHQEEKKERNRLLIVHLTSLTEKDRKYAEKKQRECVRLERERDRYEQIIRDCRQEARSSSARHTMAKRLHDDLVKQRVVLEDKRDEMRRREIERGIREEVIVEYTETQRLLAREQEKKQNLLKKMVHYEKEIAKTKILDNRDVFDNYQGLAPTAKLVLPPIAQKQPNIVRNHVANDPVRSNLNTVEMVNNTSGYTDELGNHNFVPRPPDVPRLNDGAFKRFCRRLRPN